MQFGRAEDADDQDPDADPDFKKEPQYVHLTSLAAGRGDDKTVAGQGFTHTEDSSPNDGAKKKGWVDAAFPPLTASFDSAAYAGRCLTLSGPVCRALSECLASLPGPGSAVYPLLIVLVGRELKLAEDEDDAGAPLRHEHFEHRAVACASAALSFALAGATDRALSAKDRVRATTAARNMLGGVRAMASSGLLAEAEVERAVEEIKGLGEVGAVVAGGDGGEREKRHALGFKGIALRVPEGEDEDEDEDPEDFKKASVDVLTEPTDGDDNQYEAVQKWEIDVEGSDDEEDGVEALDPVPFPRILCPSLLGEGSSGKYPSEAALPRVNIFSEDGADLMGELCTTVSRAEKAAYLQSLHAVVCLFQPR